MRIGLCFNLKETDAAKASGEWDDSDAEYEDRETIDSLAGALEALSGEPVVRLPCDGDLPQRLASAAVDLVFNIGEGRGSRNREAFGPSVFELSGIPYTGSDGLCLSLTLDKVLAKKVLIAEGLPTPEFCVVHDPSELKDVALPFPLFVKPCHEGTSKGIRNFSKVRNRKELERVTAWVLARHGQPALVERFIAGREVAVSVLGNGEQRRVLPHAEIRFSRENPFYSFECKTLVDEEVICPAPIGAALSDRIERIALAACEAFGCRDFARLDIRIDASGTPYILEINPLPGLSRQYSLFPVQAAAAGITYGEMVGTILDQAMERNGAQSQCKEVHVSRPDPDLAWKEQIRDRVREPGELSRFLNLETGYLRWLEENKEVFPFSVTPYLLSLVDPENPDCPIGRQFLPAPRELNDPAGLDDPLLERAHQAGPGLIRVYPDRAAWCVSSFCPSLCRHCLRRNGFQSDHGTPMTREGVASVLAALSQNSEIRDILLTGGDPLTFEDDVLEDLLARIKRLDQIQIIRVGSRLPCTLPQRITPRLVQMLRKFQPLWISTQFNHPAEITHASSEACIRIAEAGIPLLNQTVLLRGVNDSIPVMKELVEKLVRLRVRPYYLYQCQLVRGTAHFRTSVEQGMEILRGLRGRTSGFAIPQYVLDTPHGKVPLNPNYYKGRENGSVIMETFDGRLWKETNPTPLLRRSRTKGRQG